MRDMELKRAHMLSLWVLCLFMTHCDINVMLKLLKGLNVRV